LSSLKVAIVENASDVSGLTVSAVVGNFCTVFLSIYMGSSLPKII